MKKIMSFLVLVALTVAFSSVVTANEPPGQYQTFNGAICTQFEENICPVIFFDYAIIPDYGLISHGSAETHTMINLTEGISATIKQYADYPEVCGRTGPMNDMFVYTLSITANSLYITNKTGKSYTEIGYSIWA